MSRFKMPTAYIDPGPTFTSDSTSPIGSSYTVMGQRLVVSNGVLEVYESRQHTGFHQEQVLVGRFKLEPLP